MKQSVRGYILVETITAMAILSLAAVTVQRAVQVSIQARGLAQDYSVAQLLLEQIVADQRLQPRIALGANEQGSFPAPYERFQYSWTLSEVAIPLPPLPPEIPPERIDAVRQDFRDYMGRLQVEIDWSRAGQPFSVMGETLFGPDQAWRPPVESLP